VIVFFNTVIDYCQLKITKLKRHYFYGAFCLGGSWGAEQGHVGAAAPCAPAGPAHALVAGTLI